MRYERHVTGELLITVRRNRNLEAHCDFTRRFVSCRRRRLLRSLQGVGPFDHWQKVKQLPTQN